MPTLIETTFTYRATSSNKKQLGGWVDEALNWSNLTQSNKVTIDKNTTTKDDGDFILPSKLFIYHTDTEITYVYNLVRGDHPIKGAT